ncbi:histidine phosphatase family protein [Alginatibacterium sediminis]|uniref:phosphoglycerate mutase (2,3-diphosphoglycerate-dependent) n=1 Tax=Alginatibacterium sediminis TaxID=2164068 RepID=A0A420EH92_9ALTE|nr:histidine phosphatase family protein [Alginatibacterium sediminis]RKF20082.1 histidine phosphatase family protein [Alginatibacterium sediminis]
MTILYFMRHAESEANQQDILASQMDFELTSKGHSDAKAIAQQFLVQHHIDRVISSPLLRAQQTAQAFLKPDLKLSIEPAVIEQDLGRFAGMSYAQLENEQDYCHERSQRWLWQPNGGGESYEMIAQRLLPFFKQFDPNAEQALLVVTHAVTMRLIKALLENSTPDYPHDIAHNGEVWKVEFKGLGIVHPIVSLMYANKGQQAHRA